MPKRVMIVDDHAVVRRTVGSLFASRGFEVCAAENGIMALQTVCHLNPNLIVVDLVMPGMSGLEAARRLKKLLPEVPVMIFTNVPTRMIEKEAFKMGVSAVLSKSDSADLLIAKASALLN
jgi:CheY-like chemotaxis protein